MKLPKVKFSKFNIWFYYYRPLRKVRRERRKIIKHYIKEYKQNVIEHIVNGLTYEFTTNDLSLLTIKALRYLAIKYKAKFEWKKDIVGFNCTKGFRVWILK